MPRLLRTSTLLLLPLLTLALGFQLGMRFEENRVTKITEQLEFLYGGKVSSGQAIQDPAKDVDYSLLHGVWRLLLKHYIVPENLKVQPMLFGAARGLVDAIDDPYTTFMDPEENHEFQQSLQGRLEGIGAELTVRDGQIVIVSPLKGSPASQAGLLPEDIITEVDDESIEGWSLHRAVAKIRGPRGSTVKLTIGRKNEAEPLKIPIVRDEIKVPSTEVETKKVGEKTIGYIALNQFGESTARELEAAVRDFLTQEVDGLILDVRNNGGGYLERAVEIVSLFVRQGKVVTVEYRDRDPENHHVNGRPLTTDLSIVVLINEGSASASEILAGALQDHRRATVIGKKSFGKGTIQEVFELPGGSSVRVTTARWFTPGGRDLGEEGVDPDIEVERTVEQIQAKEDPQLDAALEFFIDKKDASPE